MLEGLELLGEELPRTTQTGTGSTVGHIERRGQVCPAQLLEVVQLDGDLVLERDPPKSLQERSVALLGRNHSRRRRREIVQSGHREIDATFFDAIALQVVVEARTRGAEQIRPKARVATKAIGGLETREEGLLHEVLRRPFADLGAEEPVDVGGVSVEELRP